MANGQTDGWKGGRTDAWTNAMDGRVDRHTRGRTDTTSYRERSENASEKPENMSKAITISKPIDIESKFISDSVGPYVEKKK